MLADDASAIRPGHLWAAVAALLAFDGGLAFLEGWALHRRWWWAPWLVVILTVAFVPAEIVALTRHASDGRGLLLVFNVAVALYPARRALREVRRRRSDH